MGKVIAGITTSVDGYVTGPQDGPGQGLGAGGERLHAWVFGGPWSYDEGPSGQMEAEDQAWMDAAMGDLGAVVGRRWPYQATAQWRDQTRSGVTFCIVTHRPQEKTDG